MVADHHNFLPPPPLRIRTRDLSLREIQQAQKIWEKHNFPNNVADNAFLGMVEELGELAHAKLKLRQGIRGTPAEHTAAMQNAIGDLAIFIMSYCNHEGWDYQRIVNETWDEVERRDWVRYPQTGRPPADASIARLLAQSRAAERFVLVVMTVGIGAALVGGIGYLLWFVISMIP